MFVLKGILRAETQEKILRYLLAKESGYGKAIAEFYAVPLNPIQKQLARMEEDGLVIAEPVGAARVYRINPRFPFIEPLKEMLSMALDEYPHAIKRGLLINRGRPRTPGKPLSPMIRENSYVD